MGQIIYRRGNVIDELLKPFGEISSVLHCCNSKGVMGSGIAKEIKQRVPKAFKSYVESGMVLGEISAGATDECEFKRVINMVAQHSYGGGGRRYVNYGALTSCLLEVSKPFSIAKYYDGSCSSLGGIGIPMNMCCDRAGGDWSIVVELVSWYLCPYTDVYVYEL